MTRVVLLFLFLLLYTSKNEHEGCHEVVNSLRPCSCSTTRMYSIRRLLADSRSKFPVLLPSNTWSEEMASFLIMCSLSNCIEDLKLWVRSITPGSLSRLHRCLNVLHRLIPSMFESKTARGISIFFSFYFCSRFSFFFLANTLKIKFATSTIPLLSTANLIHWEIIAVKYSFDVTKHDAVNAIARFLLFYVDRVSVTIFPQSISGGFRRLKSYFCSK